MAPLSPDHLMASHRVVITSVIGPTQDGSPSHKVMLADRLILTAWPKPLYFGPSWHCKPWPRIHPFLFWTFLTLQAMTTHPPLSHKRIPCWPSACLSVGVSQPCFQPEDMWSGQSRSKVSNYPSNKVKIRDVPFSGEIHSLSVIIPANGNSTSLLSLQFSVLLWSILSSLLNTQQPIPGIGTHAQWSGRGLTD